MSAHLRGVGVGALCVDSASGSIGARKVDATARGVVIAAGSERGEGVG